MVLSQPPSFYTIIIIFVVIFPPAPTHQFPPSTANNFLFITISLEKKPGKKADKGRLKKLVVLGVSSQVHF